VYPATQIGEQVWMSQNLAWISSGSVPVNGDTTNTPSYGLLYPYSDVSAVPETTDHWRLATQADYTNISSLSYAQLTSSGTGSPHLQQGGFALSDVFSSFGSGCFYWTATLDNHSQSYTQVYSFTANSSGTQFDLLPTSAYSSFPSLFYCSVRYVRDIRTTAQIAKLREG
jgi:uncharacterized protein (TIGR02145 family)